MSLSEGSTPLVHAPRLSARVGADVWLKLEGLNPTGSFKDRGMTCAVSAAVREGAETIVCASTGNTAASAAAYAARGGLGCAVIVPEGKIATGKLAQALAHGARVIALRGNFDTALKLVRELADTQPIALVNSVNEFRIEGQKTAAFEVAEELDSDLDALCIPVGNAGNITDLMSPGRRADAPGATPAQRRSGSVCSGTVRLARRSRRCSHRRPTGSSGSPDCAPLSPASSRVAAGRLRRSWRAPI